MCIQSTYCRLPHLSFQGENDEAKLNGSMRLCVVRDERQSTINHTAALWGWRALHKRQTTAKTQHWAMLLGKSWVVLPNLSAILSKISEMPIFKSYFTTGCAGWGCSLRSDCGALQRLIASAARRICRQSLSELWACFAPQVPLCNRLEALHLEGEAGEDVCKACLRCHIGRDGWLHASRLPLVRKKER